ncbi:hypothetical protein ACQKL5_14945 [Peribacillus sp. NPDC097675]|uniref:hypothetical protein n=1 Tax=Peribacillus sp. NPDC097675 TaxID=3390618 RepID=UPI003CFD818B
MNDRYLAALIQNYDVATDTSVDPYNKSEIESLNLSFIFSVYSWVGVFLNRGYGDIVGFLAKLINRARELSNSQKRNYLKLLVLTLSPLVLMVNFCKGGIL